MVSGGSTAQREKNGTSATFGHKHQANHAGSLPGFHLMLHPLLGNGRGGGSPRVAQGSVDDELLLEAESLAGVAMTP